jgi:hypothetical protein
MAPDDVGFDGDFEDAMELTANASEATCLTRAERAEVLAAIRYTSVTFGDGGGAGVEEPTDDGSVDVTTDG